MNAAGLPSVGVVGLGYVGLPLAVCFAEAGLRVVGVDHSSHVVEGLQRSSSHIEDVGDDRLAAVASSLSFSTSPAALAEVDAILICVPTPLTANREPDLTALVSAAHAVGTILRADQLVVLESTTYPGTTRERLVPMLEEASGLRAGVDFAVAYSPERIDPGRTDYTLANTPKTVGGLTAACGEAAATVYGRVCEDVRMVSSPDIAEFSKLLENIFRSVNIALVNELAMLAERMQLDIHEIIDAAASKPYGFMRFDPGPGMGGHCLPIDPFYLSWRAREYDFATEFVELAGKINQQMPYHCVQRAERTLNDLGKPVSGSRVVLLGVSYKPGVGDTRESPALKIATLLQALGADVRYHDPHVPELHQHGLAHQPLEAALAGADLAIVVTPHPHLDYDEVAGGPVPVLDLRGVVGRQQTAVGSI